MNFGKILYKAQSIPYEIKCLIFPYNRIKLQGLDRHYHDQDEVMFHSMFQCLVDYVELEHPFRSWREGDKKRFTDISAMQEYIETSYGPSSDLAGDIPYPEEELKSFKKQMHRQYTKYKEQLYLYIWYKKVYPNRIEPSDYLGDFGIDDIFDTSINKYPNGVITFSEYADIDDEQDLVEDIMLERVLRIRRSLWT